MKRIPVFLLLVSLFSCHSSVPKFTSKTDSTQVVYRDREQGPFLFVGLYQTSRTFVPTDSGSTSGRYVIDTSWVMKQQTDTFTSKTAQHKYSYTPVLKQNVQIITVPRPN